MNTNIKLHKSQSVLGELPKPKNLDQMIGQTRAITYVKGLVEGAERMGVPTPHLLILAPSGGGKTTLAECIASKIGTSFFRIICSEELSPNDLAHLLGKASKFDVVYLDEVHSLSRSCQEFLYQVIDRGCMARAGERGADTAIEVKLPPFTLVMSTNHPGSIRKELMNRLVTVEFDEYSDEDIGAIIRQASRGFEMTASAIEGIARASHGIPRHALMMLKEISFISNCENGVSEENVRRLYELKRFSPEGLHHYHRKLLEFLFSQPDNTARLGILSDKLGLDGSFIRKQVEPVVINKGYLMVTPMGRKLTRAGREYVAAALA